MRESEALVEIYEIFGGRVLANRLREMGVRTHGLNAVNLERHKLKVNVQKSDRTDLVEWTMTYGEVSVEFRALEIDKGIVELASRFAGEPEYIKTVDYLRKIGVHADGVLSMMTWPESGYPVDRYKYSLANFVVPDEGGSMIFEPREV